MSLPNLAGIIIYIVVVCVCLLASIVALVAGRPVRHIGVWLGVSAFFSLMGVARLFMIEDRIRAALRQLSRHSGSYSTRAYLQMPLVAVTLVGALIGLLFAIRALRRSHANRQDSSLLAALCAVGGYVPLYALRIISWHDSDQILYYGKIHFNWLIDVALALVAGASAIFYMLAPSDRINSGRARRGRR